MFQIAGVDGDAVLNALASSDVLAVYDLALTGDVIPMTCEDAATGTLLALFSLSSPWAGPAASGSNSMPLNGTPITSTVITTTGTPAYFRFTTSSGVCNMQGNIGRTGTLDSDGNPWDMTTDGQRWTQGNTATINELNFVSLNNDFAF